jgi:hypothetical protein
MFLHLYAYPGYHYLKWGYAKSFFFLSLYMLWKNQFFFYRTPCSVKGQISDVVPHTDSTTKKYWKLKGEYYNQKNYNSLCKHGSGSALIKN